MLQKLVDLDTKYSSLKCQWKDFKKECLEIEKEFEEYEVKMKKI